MKGMCVRVVMFAIGLFSLLNVEAQSRKNLPSDFTIIEPYRVSVGTNKTSNIIFPFSIKSADQGSSDILAQVANGTENVLQLKAAVDNFKQTNLSVVTSDGRFYSFILEYDSNPAVLNIVLGRDSIKLSNSVSLTGVAITEDKLFNAAEIIKKSKRITNYKTKQQRMKATLQGIYLHEDATWFKLLVKNKSLIGFDLSSVRFIVKDKVQTKRTSIQEKEIFPLFTYPCPAIKGNGKNYLILGFSPFTISKNQELIIRIEEKNGGRLLLLKLPAKALLKVKVV